MELKEGYKLTEVGFFPKDWKIKKISKLFKFKNGLNKDKKYFGYGSPIINYMDVYQHPGLKKINIQGKVDVTSDEKQAYAVKKGDVFFTRTSETVDEIGISSVLIDEMANTVFSGFILRARPENDELTLEFKKYCFSSAYIRKQISSTSSYTTRALTNGTLLSNVQLSFPPSKDEQNAIAKSLCDVDALITQLEKLITKKHLLKQGAMQKLLNPFNEDGELKGGWEEKKLGDLCLIQMGQSPSSKFYNTKGQGLPLIQGNADIKNRRTIIRNYTADVTKKGIKGDIIMSVRAPVGEVAKAYFDACLGRGVCAIRYKNDFIYHYLISIEPNWGKLSTGSTFESVNSTEINATKIYIPRLEKRQIEIASILNDLDTEISSLESKLTKTKKIKMGMMQSLLTGKIRLVKPKGTTT